MARKNKSDCACKDGNAPRRSFGSLRILPSGQHQARYRGPDGRTYTADWTFDTHLDAEAFLEAMRTDIRRGAWTSPDAPKTKPMQSFETYATEWLATRTLKPNTRWGYSRMLTNHLIPMFGSMPLATIDSPTVRSWYSEFAGKASVRTAVYSLFRAIMMTACYDDGLIPTNPVRVRGASANPRQSETQLVTEDQLDVIVREMPERLKLAVHLAAWTAVRQGELLALTRADVDLQRKLVRVRRAVTRTPGEVHVLGPKTKAGTRDVHYAPHIHADIVAHLRDHVGPEPDALLFATSSGDYLHPTALLYHFRVARVVAGRKDLRWHDLRHDSLTKVARTGATTAEVMARAGHASARAALIYQHGSADRDQLIAARLSEAAKRSQSV